MHCPRCQTPLATALEPTYRGRVELDFCPRCRGVWFDAEELSAVLGVDNRSAFALDSPLLSSPQATALRCPRGAHAPLSERELASDRLGSNDPLRLDQCPSCEGVWLDGDELHALAARLRQSHAQPFLKEPTRNTSLGLWLFMLLTQLPVEQWNPRLRRPVITVLLIAACVVAFLWQLSVTLEQSVQMLGLFPSQIRPLTLLSSMFLHGSVAHLLGNMYFLWLFGDNVEDRLGRGRYLLLYLLAGLGAGLCHSIVSFGSNVPVVGASGAISGVMAAYAVLFPHARLVSLVFIFPVRWRASTYLLMWLGLQILGALFSENAIAWWAHIGGYAVGAVLARRWLKEKPPLPTNAPPKPLEWR